ncbi:Hypothetical protein NTJ_05440 [Nesidiocoris tenuis]|uniref:Uncharacterized protein n=1 Tax=Nesidiocoris tenuis TaxID=355587 RepID=A0ABN7AK55_9HEMI|nr:Hypothetical protein NTJ_05440 [Nesidiocoris tenuis]
MFLLSAGLETRMKSERGRGERSKKASKERRNNIASVTPLLLASEGQTKLKPGPGLELDPWLVLEPGLEHWLDVMPWLEQLAG